MGAVRRYGPYVAALTLVLAVQMALLALLKAAFSNDDLALLVSIGSGLLLGFAFAKWAEERAHRLRRR